MARATRGIYVEFLQPRRLEEHDFGHDLNLACNDNVSFKRDNITRSRNANEGIGRSSCDFAFVIREKDLANEYLGTEFDCGSENYGTTSQAEMLISNKVIWQEVQADSDGDAVQVIHKTGDVVVGNNGSDPIILDVE